VNTAFPRQPFGHIICVFPNTLAKIARHPNVNRTISLNQDIAILIISEMRTERIKSYDHATCSIISPSAICTRSSGSFCKLRYSEKQSTRSALVNNAGL
jgi:hypothetical protein